MYGIGGVVVVAYGLYVFVVAGPISADKVMEMLKKRRPRGTLILSCICEYASTKTKETAYDLLGDALAQRTFEESGNYVVKPYRINITECVDNFRGSTLNLGAYTTGEKTDEYLNAQP